MSYDKESLVLNNLELAKNVAISEWRTATHALQKDDMIALANLGLVDAANRWEAYCKKNNYDPEAINYFQVFARLRIRGTIRDQIRKDDWATRTLRSKSKRLKEAGQDEGLPVEELSERTGMSVTDIRKVNARLASRPISLDAHLVLNGSNFDGNTSPNETYLRNAVDTEGAAFSQEMIRTFVSTLVSLDPDIRVVLILHYYSRLDLRKIAEELALPEAKVSQLHSTGVVAVKDALTSAAQERD